jgi:hypothetical protein
MIRRISWRAVAGALFVWLGFAASAGAAPPAVGTAFVSVTLDGVRLGEDFTPNFHSLFPTVVFDPATGTFHMWVFDGSGFRLGALRHAASTDGVHFQSTGNLSYAGGPPFPGFGAASEPPMEFVRAARFGAAWKLLMWTFNDGTPNSALHGQYNYNISVNDLGSSPANLSATHQGPVQPISGGVAGQVNGAWGLIGSSLFFEWDNLGGVGRFAYADAAPPAVTGAVAARDLVTGTGFVYGLSNPSDPLAVYPHNVGRTIDQGDGTYGTYYALRFWQTGARVNKQIYYAESSDGGATWGNPLGLFANGNLVTVDGAPNQENFSHPEVVVAGPLRLLYFSTRAGDGHLVVVTNAPALLPAAVPAVGGAGLAVLTLALLLTGWSLLRERRGSIRPPARSA